MTTTKNTTMTTSGEIVETKGALPEIKTTVTKISIHFSEDNSIFNSIEVGPDDHGGGSFLKINNFKDDTDGEVLTVDWSDWDALVKVVKDYRKEWEW